MTIATDEKEIAALRKAGRVVAQTIAEMRAAVEPGISTAELDAIGEACMRRYGAQSAPKLVYNFPGATCLSVNDGTVHGVPNDTPLQPGDVLTIDVTVELNGFMADAAITVQVPPETPDAQKLIAVTRTALAKALHAARAGAPINAVGRAVEREVRMNRFTVIPQLTGHGVGRTIHEDPTVPNFFHPRYNQKLTDGMVVAIEPIISAGNGKIITEDDGWTINTADGALSAHFEHTVIITPDEPIILTRLSENGDNVSSG